jgi:hypothetical protein
MDAGLSKASELSFKSDWISVSGPPNPYFDRSDAQGEQARWVLSLGGRALNFGLIADALDGIKAMLKCGFEFEHYRDEIQQSLLAETMQLLTPEEQWVLQQMSEPFARK